MAKTRRSTCRDCGASGNDVPISLSGRCPDCSADRWQDAMSQMQHKEGRAYDHWRAGMANAVGPIGRPPTPYPPDA